MNRKELEARHAGMKQAYDQHLANANAAAGAMQEIQYWLDKLPPDDDGEKQKPDLKVVGED